MIVGEKTRNCEEENGERERERQEYIDGSFASGGDLINIRWHVCFSGVQLSGPNSGFSRIFSRTIHFTRPPRRYLINITFSSRPVVSRAAIRDSFQRRGCKGINIRSFVRNVA